MPVRSLGWEDSPEEGMATHSSILFFFFRFICFNWRLITPVFLHGESHGQRSLVCWELQEPIDAICIWVKQAGMCSRYTLRCWGVALSIWRTQLMSQLTRAAITQLHNYSVLSNHCQVKKQANFASSSNLCRLQTSGNLSYIASFFYFCLSY